MPILVVLVALVAFHFTFIYRFPQPKRFWTVIDYFWVGLGCLGLLGSSASLRKEISRESAPFHYSTIRNYYNLYLLDLEFEEHYFLDKDGFNYGNWKDKDAVKAFQLSGLFFKSLKEKSLNLKNNVIKDHQFEYIDTLKNIQNKFFSNTKEAVLKGNSASMSHHLKVIEDEINIINNLNISSEKTSLDWIILHMSPVFLSLAIAIRLTKVTFQLREERMKT